MKEKICGIYCIEAVKGNPKKIGFKYVGQSKNCIERFWKHKTALKSDNHPNLKLQNYYNKYNINSFKFMVIKKCFKNELDFWEKWFIKCFDSFKNGFNCTLGGDVMPNNKKLCIMQNIYTNEIEKFDSIQEFADKYNFSNSGVSDVIRCKSNYIKDWFCPQNNWRPKFRKIISPTGKEYQVFNSILFCKQHNIYNKNHNFSAVLSGRKYSYKGWKSERAKKDSKINHYINFKFINDKNEIIEGKNLKKFSKENKLSYSSIHGVLSGKRKSCGGYKLYKEEKC